MGGHLDKRYKMKALSEAELTKKGGASNTLFHRSERGKHRITLNKLESILGGLKLKLQDVFPQEYE
jgi:hypothetical protein